MGKTPVGKKSIPASLLSHMERPFGFPQFWESRKALEHTLQSRKGAQIQLVTGPYMSCPVPVSDLTTEPPQIARDALGEARRGRARDSEIFKNKMDNINPRNRRRK